MRNTDNKVKNYENSGPWCIFGSFIQSKDKYLLSTYYVPQTVLGGVGDTMMNEVKFQCSASVGRVRQRIKIQTIFSKEFHAKSEHGENDK